MLTQLEVSTGVGDALALPIAHAYTAESPLQIKDIQGLGPVKADISTLANAVNDGDAYLGASVGKRNVVLTIGFNPDWVDQTIESLRDLLYVYFMPRTMVTLKFHSTHLPECFIVGHVESADPNMFSKDPEFAVSIICPAPDFIAMEATTVEGVVVSAPDAENPNVIENVGTVPSSVILRVDSSVARPSFTGTLNIFVQSGLQANSFSVDVDSPIDADWFFRMDSSPFLGQKYIRRIKVSDGTQQNLLGDMHAGSVWPLLRRGINVFEVFASSPGQDWSLEYYARFGGL